MSQLPAGLSPLLTDNTFLVSSLYPPRQKVNTGNTDPNYGPNESMIRPIKLGKQLASSEAFFVCHAGFGKIFLNEIGFRINHDTIAFRREMRAVAGKFGLSGKNFVAVDGQNI